MPEMKYLYKRQNPISDVPIEQLNKLFQVLADKFSEDWLSAESGHPIQALWNRRDWIATTELLLLAVSIHNLEKIDPIWVKDQIKNAKNNNENTRKGAIFEIISLEGILNNRMSVKPARRNQEGYDGIIKLGEGEVILSIKNYSLSYHHRAFLDRCKQFENRFVNLLTIKKIRNVMALIDINKWYPSEKDWKDLENSIDSILSHYTGELFPIIVNNTWNVFLKAMKDDANDFDEKYNHSYTMIITSAYHKNEHENLYSKLQSACYNLTEAKITENENRINCVLIHVPLNISIESCVQWGNDYFHDYPDDPISCIIYYQPAVVTDTANNTSHIHHCLNFSTRDRYNQFSMRYGPIGLHFPVGTHGYKSTRPQFVNEKGQTLSISGQYIFQSGNLYYKMKTDGSGFHGTMKHEGEGIYNHLILEIDGHLIKMQGIIPESHDLLIL